MLDKLTVWIENHLAGPMAKIANQRHLRAVRDGIIATLPLIIVGSFFLIIAFPPLPESWGITQFLTSNAATILLPYRMTMYIMALYATFGIGASLAKSYNLDQVSGGILATIAFLLTLVPVAIPEEASKAAGVSGFVLPMANLGGAGATIGLAILLAFRAKSEYGSKLGKAILAPSIFNINEPVIFGVPIVLNPILMIPFIFAPMVLATIAWFATKLGLVSEVVFTAPWTLPGPIGAFMATGGDWRAAVLNIVLILVAILIYYPFFVAYDKNELAKEQGKQIEE